MRFVILKFNPMAKCTVLVNDSEGIPMEYDTEESAQKMADIFTANSSHNCTYKVVKMSQT